MCLCIIIIISITQRRRYYVIWYDRIIFNAIRASETDRDFQKFSRHEWVQVDDGLCCRRSVTVLDAKYVSAVARFAAVQRQFIMLRFSRIAKHRRSTRIAVVHIFDNSTYRGTKFSFRKQFQTTPPNRSATVVNSSSARRRPLRRA